jgi:hypothetical protein
MHCVLVRAAAMAGQTASLQQHTEQLKLVTSTATWLVITSTHIARWRVDPSDGTNNHPCDQKTALCGTKG